MEFVNPDLMAQGVSPLDIRLSSFEAAKQTLRRIRTLASGRASFAFESTLAGRGYLGILESLRGAGYELDFYYLRMPRARPNVTARARGSRSCRGRRG